ncbi:MAG: exo-alpha-sialidase [Armatimonadetes bacterium]|nr:exo-alpha-sialidase [Armatimonadota bacterium]
MVFLVSVLSLSLATTEIVPPQVDEHALGLWRVLQGRMGAAEGCLELDGLNVPGKVALAFRGDVWVERPLEIAGEFFIRSSASAPTDVRAAGVAFCGRDCDAFYYVHFDSRNSQVILVRHAGDAPWIEIARRRDMPLAWDQWHSFSIRASETAISVIVDGTEVLSAADAKLTSGLIGLRAGQGIVRFRRISVSGTAGKPNPDWERGSKMLEVIKVAVSSEERYYAFPSIARLADGRLAVVFYDGTGHVSPDGRIDIVISEDEGRTWTKPRTIIDSPTDDRDPSIMQTREGTILVSCFRYDGRERKQPTRTFVYRSVDGGQTFDDGRPLDIGWEWEATSDEILQLPDGTLLCPIYGVMRPGETERAAVVFSHDDGRTWQRETVSTIAYSEDGRLHFQEPALALLPDGRVLCELRTELLKPERRGFYNIYESISSDGGRTWDQPRELPLVGQACGLLVHSSGLIFHAYRKNGVSAILRRPDEDWDPAKEFPVFMVGGDAAYPSAVELSDGSILCVFYAREHFMIGAVRIPNRLIQSLHELGARALDI